MGSDRDIVERLESLAASPLTGSSSVGLIREAAATIETLRAEILPLRRLHDALVNAGNDPEKAKTEMAVAGLEADMARVNTDSTGALGKEGQHGQV